MKIKDKVCVVTGAAGGIGEAIARRYAREGAKGVVVAEIVEAVQHPNADRLRVCKVLAGAFSPDGPLQIVCGAPNARVGIRVPLALVGAGAWLIYADRRAKAAAAGADPAES